MVARDALSAAADQKRIDDEAERVTEQQARVATLTPKTPKGEEEQPAELTQQARPIAIA